MAGETAKSVREKFDTLDSSRSSHLQRARKASELTIPSLLPPEGHSEDTDLVEPYQSLGSRGVNNLAAKIMLALFPPGQKFFMLSPDDAIMEQLEKKMNIPPSEVKKKLSEDENRILKDIETSNMRPQAYEAIRHLVACGNAMIFLPEKGGMKMFPLNQYVTRRDREGNHLESIVWERLSPEVLDNNTKQAVGITDEQAEKNEVDVYTHIRLKGNKWRVSQEINEKPVPNSRATYPKNKSAWVPLRWTANPGGNYGEGLAMENIGDLRAYEGLQKSLLQLAANSAKLIWLLSPNGHVRPRHFQNAENGEHIAGEEGDISAVQPDKAADLRAAIEQAGVIEGRLQQVFLLTSSIQRDAERVTATEIQTMAQELEDALGGVYSVLSQDFQLPVVNREIARLQKKNVIRTFPDGSVEPQITTGIEALGRGGDLKKLKAFLGDIVEFGPEIAAQRLNLDDLLTRLAAARGLDTTGLVKDREQMKQENRGQQMQQLIQEAGPDVVKQMADRQMGQGNQTGGSS